MRTPHLSSVIGVDQQEFNNLDYFDQSTGILYQKLLNNPKYSIKKYSLEFNNSSIENIFRWT
jgi:hypothetical protein